MPLLSPPLIAVVYRPLAALPRDAGAYIAWAVSLVAVLGTIGALVRRRPITTSLAVILLCMPLTLTLDIANVNSLLFLGAVASWWLYVRGRYFWSGVAIAVMAAVKLTPGPLATWLLLSRRSRRQGLYGLAVSGLVCAIVSVAGSGLAAHIDYLEVIRHTQDVGTTGYSLAGLGRSNGIAPEIARWFPDIYLLVSVGLMVVYRDRPGWCYSIAVLAWIFGSPVVGFDTLTLLIALVAPLAWPAERSVEPRTDPALVSSPAFP